MLAPHPLPARKDASTLSAPRGVPHCTAPARGGPRLAACERSFPGHLLAKAFGALPQSVEGNGNRSGHEQKDGSRPQRAGPRGFGLASLAGLLVTAAHGVPSSASFARPVP